MTKPRILYLVHQYGHLTGVELHTQALVEGLGEQYEISIAWPDSKFIRLRATQAGQHAFPNERPSWPASPLHCVRTSRIVDKILELTSPDIIHIQHFLHWPLSIIHQAVASGSRVVVSFHDHYALSPDYALCGNETPEETVSPDYARRIFDFDISTYLQDRRDAIRDGLAGTHALVTVSQYIEEKIAEVFGGEFRRIEYGINPFKPLPKTCSAAALRFGFLGQHIPMKGLTTLLSAFGEVTRRHSGVELHCYGGTHRRPPENVYFHGPYQPCELARICSCLDVGVIPSLFAETHCMVLSEMWRGRLPVVASDIGAMHDRVVEGVNGKKFRPGDCDDLVRTLCWFADTQVWKSWELPRPKTAPEMVADYDYLYQELLGGWAVNATSSRFMR